MTLRKGLLILAFLTASEFIFSGCSQRQRNKDLQTESLSRSNKTPKILISEYDEVMMRVAQQNDIDWRFIAAIGYHESRFQNDVVSPVGAIGVMQIMPSVARAFGVTTDSVAKADVNIETAAKVLKSIESSLIFPKQTLAHDRLKIVLACYNAGIGHVIDARRLAAKNGVNHNKWSELEGYLRVKGSPEYVGDESVRCGAFDSGQTIAFVSSVMEQYEDYCRQYPGNESEYSPRLAVNR